MKPTFDRRTQDPERAAQERQARNQDMLVRFGILLAVALFISSSVPGPLFAATLSSFLFFFAIGSAVAAGFAREAVNPETLTRWDQGAALMALSLLAKLFVDPEVVRQAASGAL